MATTGTGDVTGRARGTEIAWEIAAGLVRLLRIGLTVPVALIAFPMAGIAVLLIEVAMLLWPFGEKG